MMNDSAYVTETDVAAWARDHQVRWQLAPVQEMVKGRGVQPTGYSLRLLGRLPVDFEGDVATAARSIYAGLHTIATRALDSLPIHALVRIEPPGRAVVANESRLVVDVELVLVAAPADASGPRPPAELRRLIELAEARLRAMGLRKS